ncbi:MAG: diguanylate cyclase [Clostridia bacterium]|nr:diguanylate cyclase [Clostridia bacterium]
MEEDRSVVESLLEECDRQTSQYTGKEMDYAKKALELSKTLQYDIGIYESHFRIARSLMSRSENEEAIEHLDICYAIAQTLGDILRTARTANSLGIAYYNLGITSKSLDYLLEALDLSKNNSFIEVECRVYNNICSILIELGEYETAIQYLFSILAECNLTHPSIFPIGIIYRNLAQTYYSMGKIDDAEYYGQLAMEEAVRDQNAQMLCESHYIMGQIRAKQESSQEAYFFLQKALDYAVKTNNDYYLVQIRIDISKHHASRGEAEKALLAIQEAYDLVLRLDYPVLKRSVFHTMAEICKLNHNKEMLIHALTLYMEVTKSLEAENVKRQQSYIKAQLMVFNLKKDNERLRVEIERDPLTGCLSSRTFPDRISQALTTYGSQGALIFLDIDNLKIVNDSYGHDTGDALLKSFAQDLMAVMPPEALKIRIAGDEFLVFMPRAGRKEATEALDKLLQTLAKPRLIGIAMIPVLLSAGIALYPEHSSDILNLRKMADAAMYSAKQAGRGIYRIYNAS